MSYSTEYSDWEVSLNCVWITSTVIWICLSGNATYQHQTLPAAFPGSRVNKKSILPYNLHNCKYITVCCFLCKSYIHIRVYTEESDFVPKEGKLSTPVMARVRIQPSTSTHMYVFLVRACIVSIHVWCVCGTSLADTICLFVFTIIFVLNHFEFIGP